MSHLTKGLVDATIELIKALTRLIDAATESVQEHQG